jgi:hypothetical protein
MLDMRTIVSTTYEMEGDGLPHLLAYSRVEGLRATGRTLQSDGSLPNVDAVLRQSEGLVVGTAIRKNWPGFGLCDGSVTAIDVAESTLYPGRERTVYTVRYPGDGAEEDLEEEEIRPLLVISTKPERTAIIEGIHPAFQYIEDRITGNCDRQYDCSHMYNILRLVQAFDPSFAATSLSQPLVEELSVIIPIGAHDLIPGLVRELPQYLAVAASWPGFNRADVAEFTSGVLKWWKVNHPHFPTWAKAARIVFDMLPSSAPSERVFSLVEGMFGRDQLSALGDMLQGSMMLRYNKRSVG